MNSPPFCTTHDRDCCGLPTAMLLIAVRAAEGVWWAM
jgi:hypothetical protein